MLGIKMSQWKKVRIGNFLTERTGRYKPDDSTIAQYQRLDKIDFSGTIHISNKPTKTDMILVQPGDLVISGINVAKGAVSVYQGTEPVCATIHYSAYTFNENIVDLDFFRFFVKSPAFLEALKRQVKGGIKTEIKPKHLLPLEISIPDLSEQKRIVATVSNSLKKTEDLQKEIDSQKEYVKLLRQNILQDGIEGKLTVEWRKSHPVIKGNPDYDAEALFEKIQKEKASDKKQRELPTITDEEKPFEIPKGWKWVRLGEITTLITDGKHGDSVNKDNSGFYFLSAKDIQNEKLVYENARQITEEDFYETHRRTNLEPGDICIVNTGATVGKLAIAPDDLKTYNTTFQKSVAVVKLVKNIINNKYIKFYFLNDVPRLMQKSWGSAINNLLLADMRAELIALPPLLEQNEVVRRIENQLKKVCQLETQIQEQEIYTKQLMQSILKDSFKGE
ncbi:MAG: restriction endonuclease subunit S [Treponema sp.]|nr:restriction endonuclease subunit S [Treponema sp.]